MKDKNKDYVTITTYGNSTLDLPNGTPLFVLSEYNTQYQEKQKKKLRKKGRKK